MLSISNMFNIFYKNHRFLQRDFKSQMFKKLISYYNFNHSSISLYLIYLMLSFQHKFLYKLYSRIRNTIQNTLYMKNEKSNRKPYIPNLNNSFF